MIVARRIIAPLLLAGCPAFGHPGFEAKLPLPACIFLGGLSHNDAPVACRDTRLEIMPHLESAFEKATPHRERTELRARVQASSQLHLRTARASRGWVRTTDMRVGLPQALEDLNADQLHQLGVDYDNKVWGREQIRQVSSSIAQLISSKGADAAGVGVTAYECFHELTQSSEEVDSRPIFDTMLDTMTASGAFENRGTAAVQLLTWLKEWRSGSRAQAERVLHWGEMRAQARQSGDTEAVAAARHEIAMQQADEQRLALAVLERYAADQKVHVGAISQDLSDLRVELQAEFDYQADALARLQADVREGRVSQDAARHMLSDIGSDVGFLKNYFFSNMSPSEQLAAVRSGHVSVDAAQERRIGILAKQQAILETTQEWGSLAFDVVSIANELGLDDETARIVEGGIALTMTSVEAYTAFDSFVSLDFTDVSALFTGVGAVSTGIKLISNLFGAPRKDPVLEHLKHISRQLDAVLEGQQVLHSQLNAVLENQEALWKGQRKILEGLATLAEQSYLQHQDVLNTLESLRRDIGVNRELIRVAAFANIEACGTFFNKDAINVSCDAQDGSFHCAEDLEAHLDVFADEFAACRKGLREVFINDNNSRSAFGLAELTRADQISEVSQYLESVVDPTIKLWHGLAARGGDPRLGTAPEAASVLARPTALLRHVDTRLAAESWPQANTRVGDGGDLEHLRSVDALEIYSGYLLQALPLLALVDSKDATLLTGEQIAARKRPFALGRQVLKAAQARINHAIAQYAMLAGDRVLPALYEALEEDERTSDDIRVALQEPQGRPAALHDRDLPYYALAHNAQLRTNFVAYFVRRRLQTQSANLIGYELARAAGNPALLRLVLGDLELDPDTGMALFGFGACALPEARSLANTPMDYAPEMERLLELRSRVEHALILEEMLGRHSQLPSWHEQQQLSGLALAGQSGA